MLKTDVMFTAPTYDHWERFGEIEEKNGKPYTKVKTTCHKCGGSGMYLYFGTCFTCNGSGVLGKTVRLYTKEERAKLVENNERAAERRLERKKESILKAKENFYKKNGFNENGVTYMAVGDTYKIKEELKAKGCKFSGLLNWHTPEPIEIENVEFVEIEIDKVYEPMSDGYFRILDTAEEYVEERKYSTVESDSEYIGEVGEKVSRILVTVKNVSSFDGYYGTTHVYCFEDLDGNKISWFASRDQELNIEDTVYISGKIKSHELYRGFKTTYLTRCKIEKN